MTTGEVIIMEKVFDRDMFHDYVIVLGYGRPTERAYRAAKRWFKLGEPYSKIAHEVVFRGWTFLPTEWENM